LSLETELSDTPGEFWAWVVAGISLLLSFVFSGSETGYLSANKLLLKVRGKNRKLLGRFSQYYLDNPEIFLVTILIGNNLVAVTFTTIATFLLEPIVSPQLSFLLITVTLVFFGEIIPKSLFRNFADSIFIYMTPLIRLSQKLLYPLILVIEAASRAMLKIFGVAPENYKKVISRRELEELMLGATEGLDVKREQKNILSRMLKLERRDAGNAMISRTDIFALPYDIELADLVSSYSRTGYSRVIIYEDDLDNVRGYLHFRSLLNNKGDWRTLIKPILFFPETKKLDEILNEFRRKNEKIALVVDEHGGVEGLLTIEDVIEELLGEILDEFDQDKPEVRKISENSYLVDAHAPVESVNEIIPVKIPSGSNYNSVSGYVLNRSGKLPKVGDEIPLSAGWKIVVVEVSRTGPKFFRIQKNKE
jgi:CBS domain containing-hemolysin-like protein